VIRFFKTPAAWRAWLAAHHRRATELTVGFYKRGSGKPSITWPESVDEALCFGWIDGVRHRLDDVSYSIRFTPRKPDSTWSAVNVRRVRILKQQGRMRAAGLARFEQRDRRKAGLYSFEQRRTITLPTRYQRLLKANRKAWAFYQAQAPWYQRTTAFWVISAKREDTRRRRLATLIAECATGRPVGLLGSKPRD